MITILRTNIDNNVTLEFRR